MNQTVRRDGAPPGLPQCLNECLRSVSEIDVNLLALLQGVEIYFGIQEEGGGCADFGGARIRILGLRILATDQEQPSGKDRQGELDD